MQTLLILAALTTTAPTNMTPIPDSNPQQLAVMCFGKGEQTSGMNKICYYDCLGSMTAITISAVELCPLTINN